MKTVLLSAALMLQSHGEICSVYRVVVRSRSHIIKPDAIFVVFLGEKSMGIFGP